MRADSRWRSIVQDGRRSRSPTSAHAGRSLPIGCRAFGQRAIAAPDGFSTFFLCSRLGHLKAKYPSLTVQLVPMSRTFSLSKREADLAITIERPDEGRLAVRKLIDYSLHFYAAKRYLAERAPPQGLEDLQRHCVVTYVQDLIFADQLNFMPELYGPTYSRLECSTAVGQLEAIRGGAGIGILHDYAAYSDERLQIVLPDTVFERSYWIVTHLDMRELSRVRAMSEFILAEVGAQKSIFRTRKGIARSNRTSAIIIR
jgi:DNA-binding transcriptional LysR family regulator